MRRGFDTNTFNIHMRLQPSEIFNILRILIEPFKREQRACIRPSGFLIFGLPKVNEHNKFKTKLKDRIHSYYKAALAVLCLSVLFKPVAAQNELNNWSFDAGLFSFNEDPPSIQDHFAWPQVWGGAAILSSRSGQPLLMMGHEGLCSSTISMSGVIDFSVKDPIELSASFVPHPADSTVIYCFVNDGIPDSLPVSLWYAEIKLSGQQSARVVQKKVLVESACALYHQVEMNAARNGYWIVTLNPAEQSLHAYAFTSEGLATEPVVSKLPLQGDQYCSLVFNKQANMACICYAKSQMADILQFDAKTGKFSNPLRIHRTGTYNYWGYSESAFSADGSKLYVSWCGTVRQYDISSKDAATIEQSEAFVDGNWDAAIKRGPDDCIYFSSHHWGAKVIENPNCVADSLKFSYPFSIVSQIPHTVPYVPYIFQDSLCNKDSLGFKFRGIADSVRWDFGDRTSGSNNSAQGFFAEHYYAEAGEYAVTAEYFYCGKEYFVVDTVFIKERRKLFADDSVAFCPDGFISPEAVYDSYRWNTGSTASKEFIDESGSYYLTVTEDECTYTDSVEALIVREAAVPWLEDTLSCGGSFRASVQEEHFLQASSEIEWYADGGEYLVAGPSFTPSAEMLSADGSARFYVRSRLGNCLSEARAASFFRPPASPLVAEYDHEICIPSNSTVLPTATVESANADDLLWFDSQYAELNSCKANKTCSLPAVQHEGQYRYYVCRQAGECRSEYVPVQFTAFDEPSLTIKGPDSLCENAGLQRYTAEGLRDPLDVCLWSLGSGKKLEPSAEGKASSAVQLRVKEAGIDTLSLSVDLAGCTSSASKAIWIAPLPHASFTLSASGAPGEVLIVNQSKQDSIFAGDFSSPVSLACYWDFGRAEAGRFTESELRSFSLNYPSGLVTVSLKAENEFGCSSATVEKTIELDFGGKLYFPNAFAPSYGKTGAGIFRPIGQNLQTFKIWVYDNWGNTLWYSDKLTADGSPSESWDGSYKGQPLQAGVYTYKCEALFYESRTGQQPSVMRGEIMLLP